MVENYFMQDGRPIIDVFKLGELIGLAVKSAVKEALYKQTGLGPEHQHSMLKRFQRYALNEESLWQKYLQVTENDRLEKPDFIHNIHAIDRQDTLVTFSSLYIHLLDQLEWQLLSQNEIREAAAVILENVGKALGLNKSDIQLPLPGEQFPKQLIECFEQVIVRAVRGIDDV